VGKASFTISVAAQTNTTTAVVVVVVVVPLAKCLLETLILV